MLMRMLGQLVVLTLSATLLLAPWALALAFCVVAFRWLVQSSCGGA